MSSAKIFPMLPRVRTDQERLALVLGRRWLAIIEQGALNHKPQEPSVVTQARERALKMLKVRS